MAILQPPLWLQQGGYDARGDRQFISTLFESTGVVDPASGLLVSATTPDTMDVVVGAGRAVLPNGWDSQGGYYTATNREAATLTVQPADATFSRRDLVIIRVYDASYSGALSLGALEIVKGEPSGSPQDPALPKSSIALARITVTAAANAITNANINNLIRTSAVLRKTLSGADSDWISYTPSISGWTNASATGRYRRQGIFTHVQITVSQTGVPTPSGNSLTVSIPTAYPSAVAHQIAGQISFVDTSASARYAGVAVTSGANASTVIARSLGTAGLQTALSATSPFTWTSGDFVYFDLVYASASAL